MYFYETLTFPVEFYTKTKDSDEIIIHEELVLEPGQDYPQRYNDEDYVLTFEGLNGSTKLIGYRIAEKSEYGTMKLSTFIERWIWAHKDLETTDRPIDCNIRYENRLAQDKFRFKEGDMAILTIPEEDLLEEPVYIKSITKERSMVKIKFEWLLYDRKDPITVVMNQHENKYNVYLERPE